MQVGIPPIDPVRVIRIHKGRVGPLVFGNFILGNCEVGAGGAFLLRDDRKGQEREHQGADGSKMLGMIHILFIKYVQSKER